MARKTYDSNNIFARILRGEIPCKQVLETEYALAFHDINPKAPTHVLVNPKGAYVDVEDFADNASEAEIAGLLRAVAEVARAVGATNPGFRILSNSGVAGGQEVPHLHFHLFAGKLLGPMLAKD